MELSTKMFKGDHLFLVVVKIRNIMYKNIMYGVE